MEEKLKILLTELRNEFDLIKSGIKKLDEENDRIILQYYYGKSHQISSVIEKIEDVLRK
ncbi:MAG: hypothetical protein HGB12_00020 [Bacteroidetes bacterium]|nr:hypothetical protein [Bacteroidota bacterium]